MSRIIVSTTRQMYCCPVWLPRRTGFIKAIDSIEKHFLKRLLLIRYPSVSKTVAVRPLMAQLEDQDLQIHPSLVSVINSYQIVRFQNNEDRNNQPDVGMVKAPNKHHIIYFYHIINPQKNHATRAGRPIPRYQKKRLRHHHSNASSCGEFSLGGSVRKSLPESFRRLGSSRTRLEKCGVFVNFYASLYTFLNKELSK